jgi:hypothetical protein
MKERERGSMLEKHEERNVCAHNFNTFISNPPPSLSLLVCLHVCCCCCCCYCYHHHHHHHYYCLFFYPPPNPPLQIAGYQCHLRIRIPNAAVAHRVHITTMAATTAEVALGAFPRVAAVTNAATASAMVAVVANSPLCWSSFLQ